MVRAPTGVSGGRFAVHDSQKTSDQGCLPRPSPFVCPVICLAETTMNARFANLCCARHAAICGSELQFSHRRTYLRVVTCAVGRSGRSDLVQAEERPLIPGSGPDTRRLRGTICRSKSSLALEVLRHCLFGDLPRRHDPGFRNGRSDQTIQLLGEASNS